MHPSLKIYFGIVTNDTRFLQHPGQINGKTKEKAQYGEKTL